MRDDGGGYEGRGGGGDLDDDNLPRVKSRLEMEEVVRRKEPPPTREKEKILRSLTTRTNSEWQMTVGSDLAKESIQRMDFVLVYPKEKGVADDDERRGKEEELRDTARRKFLEAMEAEGIDVLTEEIAGKILLKLHTPFWRLCKEAQKERIEMPLQGQKSEYDSDEGECDCWVNFEEKYLETDKQEDFISTALKVDKIDLFQGYDDADTFFRPSIRSLLTYLILVRIDIGKKEERGSSFLFRKVDKDALVKQGLLFMLHKKFYSDAFPVHDETKDDPIIRHARLKLESDYGSQVHIESPEEEGGDGSQLEFPDTRQCLSDLWSKFRKYQPLWLIRNYFGEKIGLYFAWCGTLLASLWIPTLFGLCVFGYGLYLSITKQLSQSSSWTNGTFADKAVGVVEDSMNVVKEAFDNELTPYFAIVISLWGTIFLEMWKRTCVTLAFEWDVDSFEKRELDRPQYEGSNQQRDPVTGEIVGRSPLSKQLMKYSLSFITLLFMVLLVFIALAAVIVYRVVLTVDFCTDMSPTNCLLMTTICSSILNALAVIILGKIYDLLAVKLTDWENHRTQTQYDDSLIIKLFAFQFANSYSSLFYIAFFRGRAFQGGIFGLGSQYKDTCGDLDTSTCMPMLSFQVLVLMLLKPLPKFIGDVVIPLLKRLWRSKLKRCLERCCCCCCRSNRVDANVEGQKFTIPGFLEREFQKADVGDLTLAEYTEKVIIYGFIVMFAASLPIAPLIALLIILFDIRIDAKRLLWLSRRPVAFRAQDIGTWYAILNFLNVVGVVSNACLIAFTSNWGIQYDLVGQLIIVIAFEHIVFAVKLIIAALIPDIPATVSLAQRKESYKIDKILDRYEEQKNAQNGQIKKRKWPNAIREEDDYMNEDMRSILSANSAGKKRRNYNLRNHVNNVEPWQSDSSPEHRSNVGDNSNDDDSPTA